MHLSGLWGMPRRVYTYPSELGLGPVNLITTIGSFLFAIGVLLFFVNVAISRRRGVLAGDNPWDAPSLEWSVSSPPPPYNFAVIPTVASRYPLWEGRVEHDEELRSNLEQGMILDRGKETLATTALDAVPTRIVPMPDDTIVPFVLTLGLAGLFTGLLLRNWWVVGAAALLCALSLVFWYWPRRKLLEREPAHG
jgi:cytochrome c oxidase subunit 1/cytochrome c oxidase subunit I+III